MIEYSLYELSPRRVLNAKSQAEKMQGIYLRTKVNGRWAYADYFPHVELGDLSVNDVLEGKRDQYFSKCLWFLENEHALKERVVSEPFKNHILFTGDISSGEVYKVKVMGTQDFELIEKLVKEDITIRLDANGTISVDEWNEFLSRLGRIERLKIEYIEDPGTGDWSSLLVASARDFQKSPYFEYLIYKANSRDESNTENAIFSSYMGSDLGRYHCWLELMHKGNLNLVHGIDTPNLFKEQRTLFIRDGREYKINDDAVYTIYDELEYRSWKCLS